MGCVLVVSGSEGASATGFGAASSICLRGALRFVAGLVALVFFTAGAAAFFFASGARALVFFTAAAEAVAFLTAAFLAAVFGSTELSALSASIRNLLRSFTFAIHA